MKIGQQQIAVNFAEIETYWNAENIIYFFLILFRCWQFLKRIYFMAGTDKI